MKQKESAKSEVSGKAVEVAMRSLRKKFGDSVVNWISDGPAASKRVVVPTGSLSIDSALGVGGLVLGRMYEFFGSNASGKSTLAFSTIKEAIKLGMKAIYIDAERSLDEKLLKDMGVDPSKVVIIKGFTAEDNLDAAELLMATGEFAICVVDSVSALQPSAEANLQSFSDNTMGLHPRLMSRMCRTFAPLADKMNVAIILINQIRANLGYGASETSSGGNAIQHFISGRIKVSGGGVKSRHIKNEKGEPIGHRASFDVLKNKLAVPFRSAEVDLIWGKGFDNFAETLDLAVDMGFVDLAGSWFSYNGERLGQGRSSIVEMFRTNQELYTTIRKQVSGILGLTTQDE
jgi:recombination protein RecA